MPPLALPRVGSRGAGHGLPLLGPRPVGAGPNAVVARAELGLAILPARRAHRAIAPVAGQRRLHHGDPTPSTGPSRWPTHPVCG
jgi:hypothetical protein